VYNWICFVVVVVVVVVVSSVLLFVQLAVNPLYVIVL